MAQEAAILAGLVPGHVPIATAILFIMADDIGWFNASCYHQGVMG